MKKDPRDWTGPLQESFREKMAQALRKHGVVYDDYDGYRGYWILKTHQEYARLRTLCALAAPGLPKDSARDFPPGLDGLFFTINIGGGPLRDPQFEEIIDDILGLPHRITKKEEKS